MSARPVVIINPVAGTGGRRHLDARIALARRLLGVHGLEPGIEVTEGPGHASRLARDAREGGAAFVAAWGGDGTVNEVATALAFGTTPLAVIPAGSGNGFARELGLPRRAEDALAVAAGGQDRRVDVGDLAGHLFFNVAGIGFDAVIAERFNSRPRGRRGLLPYVFGAFREFVRYDSPHYDIVVDGRRLRMRAMLIALANGRQYGRGATIAPEARIDDGQLDVVVVEARPYLRALWDARRLFFGDIRRAPLVEQIRGATATIGTDRPCLAHVDGEAFSVESPIAAAVHAGALIVRTARHLPSPGRA